MNDAEQIAQLKEELADTRELATVATKAAISALSGLEVALKAIRTEGYLQRTVLLGDAEAKVQDGLQTLRIFIEGPDHGR